MGSSSVPSSKSDVSCCGTLGICWSLCNSSFLTVISVGGSIFSSKGVNRTPAFLHNSKMRARCPRLCFPTLFIKIDVYIVSPTSNGMSSMMA